MQTIKQVVDRAIKNNNGNAYRAFTRYVSANRAELRDLGLLEKDVDVLPEHKK